MWGNDVHGDCVTAEEAFAKACNSPEIFIPEADVIAWASAHGVLEGAYLVRVLDWMRIDGFPQGNAIYDNGGYVSVEWTNASTLQSAIANGPVKIGVAADQLEGAWLRTGGQSGWFGIGFHPDGNEDHCVTLCGYGTINWLAQQLHVQVPSGVDGTKSGYALFTWSSIGIIDTPSLLAITHEAWLRRPTTETVSQTRRGRDCFAVRRGNHVIYQTHISDNSGTWTGYGNGNGDHYLVGDWTGDRKDKLATRRGSQISYQAHIGDGGGLPAAFGNGDSEDQYLVGDWTGDGMDKFAVRRGSDILYQAHISDNAGLPTGFGDGNSEDQYLVGDWTGDGKDKLAVRRNNKIIYQTHLADDSGTTVDFGNGNSEDQYLVGDWTGDGKDKLAVRRGNQIICQSHIGDPSGCPVGFGNGRSEDGYLVGRW